MNMRHSPAAFDYAQAKRAGRYVVLLALLFVAIVTAATPTLEPKAAADLSTFLKSAVDRGDVPGVVVAVVNKDGILYNEAFGQSSTTSHRTMTKDTIFNMASMTKPITSVAIMMLVDEGKLKLDDDVARYLPKYKSPVVISKYNDADASYETRPAKRPITIRHLLTHTSGLGYGFANPMLTKIMQKTGKTEMDLPLVFDPGDGWQYGPSTRVLGNVVEAISGQKIDAFLWSRVLEPLGMHDTSYLVPTTKYSRVVAVNARGTDGTFAERPTPATIPATVQGDGGLYGTASDYGLFLRMLLNRGTLGSTRILTEKSARTMLENHMGNVVVKEMQSANLSLSRNFPVGAGRDRWGLGFQLAAEKQTNRRSPGSGTWAGIFNTHFFIDPVKEIGVIVMMQTLPFYDEKSMAVYSGVEEAVYRNLK
ncbi:MAG TPA: serine hydrolase domain-containing protein [Vicinamibacterales bacterium]|nr:serine hydrolase domain-containing protein [Vicinamibacterales bacterium]